MQVTMKRSIVLLILLAVPVLQARPSSFNVKNFGAKGDGGVADDTSSVQSAIHAATKSAGGGIVVFPMETYLLNLGLVYSANCQPVLGQPGAAHDAAGQTNGMLRGGCAAGPALLHSHGRCIRGIAEYSSRRKP